CSSSRKTFGLRRRLELQAHASIGEEARKEHSCQRWITLADQAKINSSTACRVSSTAAPSAPLVLRRSAEHKRRTESLRVGSSERSVLVTRIALRWPCTLPSA